MAPVTYTTLISTEDLAEQLSRADIAIVDCRFDLKDVTAGRRSFEAGHLPGAVYADLDRDLSGIKTGTNGRHPLPSVDALAKTLERFGISNGTQVVAYDQQTGMYASRLWWMLRWLGHDAVAVLDGGFAKWIAEGRPIEPAAPAPEPGAFVPHVRPEMLLTVSDVAAGQAGRVLIDARAPERYRGESEPLDKAAGHIPGAANRFFQDNLNADGTLRAADELAREFAEASDGHPGEDIVCYCGSGVTACHNLLALEHAGIRNAKLYAGSWSEWSADPDRPVATTER